jgi:hypothetical protein
VYARVTMFAVKPAVLPRLIAVARDRVVPRSQREPGFLRAELLTRSRINKVVYTSFWKTEFEAQQAERAGLLDEEMALFEPFAAGPAIVEGYEVSLLADRYEGDSPAASRSTTMSQ